MYVRAKSMATDERREMRDLFIIGGGINGCGIARDAAGRGYSVTLAEMSDLASATSSASTKLFHGGLRYLEYFEVRLVREALIEREILLKAMPHISWPMRFVLPYHKSMRFESNTPTSRLLSVVMPWMRGRRPAWLIRFGLFLYDNLGGREILPGTRTLKLGATPEGMPLQDKYQHAYEYSDCWIEDSRLVVLNARDAQNRGADIRVRTKVVSVERKKNHWDVECENVDTGEREVVSARMLVNAAGPWVGETIHNIARINSTDSVRLVRGSHIVTRRLYDHDKAYFFQGTDGRIIFAIPYEGEFTLIGTTDADHSDPSVKPECTEAERDYLIKFANQYFACKLSAEDVVWTYSGVRPLYDDGANNASAATRDYTLRVDKSAGAPILNIFGGKITTYRRLAEEALGRIREQLPNDQGDWTAGVPLPGGDFQVGELEEMVLRLMRHFVFLTPAHARRLVRAYGTEAFDMLANVGSVRDMGMDFGATLTEREVKWLIDKEFARTAEDVVWRRSKLGLKMSSEQINALSQWMTNHLAA